MGLVPRWESGPSAPGLVPVHDLRAWCPESLVLWEVDLVSTWAWCPEKRLPKGEAKVVAGLRRQLR